MTMPPKATAGVILIAEDDDDDYLLASESFSEVCPLGQMRRVRDGEELMEYLLQTGRYAQVRPAPPAIILLDLNMPRLDGREALRKIKAHPDLRKIPIVALTASDSDQDVLYTYSLGVNSFIRKPVGFAEFVDFLKVCYEHNLDLAKLRQEPRNR
jgi:CheY-like chemotaxis protein